jgi:hypothetical protein
MPDEAVLSSPLPKIFSRTDSSSHLVAFLLHFPLLPLPFPLSPNLLPFF